MSAAATVPSAAPPPVPAAVQRLFDGRHFVERKLAVVAFLTIAGLLIVDVAGREIAAPVLRKLGFAVGAAGVPGAQQIAIFALVVGSFCGIGITVAANSQLVPRLAFGWLPALWAPSVNRLADLFTGGSCWWWLGTGCSSC